MLKKENVLYYTGPFQVKWVMKARILHKQNHVSDYANIGDVGTTFTNVAAETAVLGARISNCSCLPWKQVIVQFHFIYLFHIGA